MGTLIAAVSCAVLAGVGVGMLWWRGASGVGGDGRRVNALRLWLDETGLAGHSIGAVVVGAVGIVALAASTMSALIPLPVVAPIAVCGSVVSLVAVLEGR
ncbi:MAG: hypothetical protein ACKOWP_02420, partial [Microbacteriaceae bacterium]